MTIDVSVHWKDGSIKRIHIDDVLRAEPGPRGVSYWKYDMVNKKELMYFMSYSSGYFNVCISQ